MSDRKTHIINTAIKLFLTGGVGVSTARIANEAGVSNGSLFNAFPTKQDLIDAIYLEAKAEMNAVFQPHLTKVFDRARFHLVWKDYLAWGRHAPNQRKAMHFLNDAGLSSPNARVQADQMTALATEWFQYAFEAGKICGPNIGFITKLFFTHLDLVIDQDLGKADEKLAFDMLCNNIGLSK